MHGLALHEPVSTSMGAPTSPKYSLDSFRVSLLNLYGAGFGDVAYVKVFKATSGSANADAPSGLQY